MAPAAAGGLFVVHKHAARHLHWDLRLELDGVLMSWAVPKGPSYDQADKRLAVHVEDHPIEYADFEGLIPAGNYGAGAVVVWDRGEWTPVEDPHEGLRKGKLLFDLKGYKLRGRWTLVKIKKGEKEWLLIKERDAWLRKEKGDDIPQASVLSGLTVEDLKAGHTPAELIREELVRLKAPKKTVTGTIEPMLAEPREAAFTREGWVFELKLDGYRLIATRQGDRPFLQSRNGHDLTGTFPEIARAVQALPVSRAVLDGELVVLDANGQPSFGRLQQRGRLSRPIEVRHAAVELPATYFVFDLLGFEDFDLRPLPLVDRKRILSRLLPPLGALRYLEHFETEGEALLDRVVSLGLEGIVGKRADAPYRSGRGPAWVKIRADRAADFAVVGYTPPKGSRDGFGALHLGDYVGGRLVYAGRAGSGFTAKQIKELFPGLKEKMRETPACAGPVGSGEAEGTEAAEGAGRKGRLRTNPGRKGSRASAASASTAWLKSLPDLKGSVWVEPELVVEVRYKEWTSDGLLRHPVFLRVRDDKDVKDCVRQDGGPAMQDSVSRGERRTAPEGDPPGDAPAPARRSAGAPERPSAPPTVQFSNLKKIYWPDDGYTKGDLIDYYRAIAPRILPWLKDRPLVLTRYPDGINGKSFYQKDAPEFTPEWMRTIGIWSEDSQREIRYFVCDTEEALLYLANLGSIPLHLWASRVGSLERPDWCVIDLDPKEAPFSDVVTVAQTLHQICERVKLPNFVKTTGKTGLHILLPLGRQCTYEQSRTLGELLARLVIRELPKITTITRQVERRGTKVYLDYLQNRFGQTIVSPYSVRPLPGATVSMPLKWAEVNDQLDPRNYTIRNAVARMDTLKKDPLTPVLDLVPDLAGVLARLSALGRDAAGERPAK